MADGAAFFSAIGNETEIIGGKPVSSYEAPTFRPGAPARPASSAPATTSTRAPPSTPTFGFTIPASGDST